MERKLSKKLFAFLLAFAMVLTGSGLSSIGFSGTKAAAKTKVTLKLNKTKATVTAGKKVTLKIQKKNVKKIKSKTWSTSKKSVATVSKGVVTGKKAGKAKIKVKVKYIAKGSKKAKKKTLTCTVTVKAAEEKATPTAAPAQTPVAAATATAAPTASPTQAPTAVPTEDPDTIVINNKVNPKAVTFHPKWSDQSNIGEEREVTIGDQTMTVKDNGTMRKDLSSKDLADTEMGEGINIGNTMEATWKQEIKASKTGGEFDQAWGNAPITQEYLDTLHSYGFNTVRLPVAWTNGDTEDGTFTIREDFLDHVEQVVNYALNNGMYVVVNDHWDNGWWGEFGACTKVDAVDDNGNPILKADGTVKQTKVPDEEWRAKAWTRYERYWTQISERFKDYSDHLIFEGGNEEVSNRLNDAIYKSTGYSTTLTAGEEAVSGNLKADELYEMANKINQKFVEVVRKTGGNNANRHLLIPGYTTGIETACDSRWVMPTDTNEENGQTKLFLSVHYYTPWDFCGDSGDGDYTLADQMALPGYFEPLAEKFSDYGIIIGECGVCNPSGVNGSVTQWFLDLMQVAANYHAVPCIWETGQYFNRAEAKLKFLDVAEFYNAVCGTNGDTSMTETTGAKALETVDVSEKKPVWSWEGRWYKNGGDNLVGDTKFSDPDSAEKVDINVEGYAEKFAHGTTTNTIDGDTTEITFDATGYQSFIKVDRTKIKNPVLLIKFLDGTEINQKGEDSIGYLQIGANSTATFTQETTVGADYVRQGGIKISDLQPVTFSDEKPYLTIAFAHNPIVTGIYIYEDESAQ